MDGISALVPQNQVETAVAASAASSQPAPLPVQSSPTSSTSRLEGPHQIDVTV